MRLNKSTNGCEVNFQHAYVDLYTPPDGLGFDVGKLESKTIYTRDVLPELFRAEYSGRPSQPGLRFQNGASMTLALTLWNKDA
jgi:hypothetical protein